jgi:hypothetical protein
MHTYITGNGFALSLGRLYLIFDAHGLRAGVCGERGRVLKEIGYQHDYGWYCEEDPARVEI